MRKRTILWVSALVGIATGGCGSDAQMVSAPDTSAGAGGAGGGSGGAGGSGGSDGGAGHGGAGGTVKDAGTDRGRNASDGAVAACAIITPSCSSCLTTSCNAQSTVCYQDAACAQASASAYQCMCSGSAVDPTACAQTWQGAGAASQAFVGCMQSQCAAACGI